MSAHEDPEIDAAESQAAPTRRSFLKQGAKGALLLPYVAPVIETILLSEANANGDEDDGDDDGGGNTNSGQGSPSVIGNQVPPPPDDEDDDGGNDNSDSSSSNTNSRGWGEP